MKAVFVTAFLCLGSDCYSYTLEGDTIIIGGKTVQIEMAYEEEPDTSDLGKKDLEKDNRSALVLESTLSFGPSFNRNSSEIDNELVDEFIGRNYTGGSFLNGMLLAEIGLTDRIKLKMGAGVSLWTQSLRSISSTISDSLYVFDSPDKGELDQVLGLFNDFGVDIIDTLGVDLNQSGFNQVYLEIPIIYHHYLSDPKSKKQVALNAGVYPGFFVSGKRNFVGHLSESQYEAYDAALFGWNKFNVSAEVGVNFEFPLRGDSKFILRGGFRRNFSTVYSSSSTYKSSRNSFNAGFGIKLNFKRHNKAVNTASI